MFTWNFQYVSKARLAETLNQLMLNVQRGDILIRIHTAIHQEEEAVELARFVKSLVPRAKIVGTSTTAVISWGKADANQCVISVTQMDECRVRTGILRTVERGKAVTAKMLCKRVKDAVVDEDTRVLLTFLTKNYADVKQFVEKSNETYPRVQMIGGIVSASKRNVSNNSEQGFVFDETGWAEDGILVASVSGRSVDSYTSYATGAQAVGKEMVITKASDNCIQSIDGKDAINEFFVSEGKSFEEHPLLVKYLPFVYSERENVPLQIRISDGKVYADHFVASGAKIRRAFVYDGKVIEDNRNLFRRVVDFEKAETIFGYLGEERAVLYPNCSKWELSAYENSNMCGCLTNGEIVCADGRNIYGNYALAVSVMGEKAYTQEFQPFAFSRTDSLATDNQILISHLMKLEKRLEESKNTPVDANFTSLLRDCEKKLLYTETEEALNEAAMNGDVKLRGYDRICMINVLDVSSLSLVFPEQMIQLTYKNFISKCQGFSKEKKYKFYVLDKWQVAIGAPSYMISLADFSKDMEKLHRILFESSEQFIAIVPIFCVIYNCTVENLYQTYHSARVEMLNKNIQFMVRNANEEHMDEESIRKKYQMVNVINYAISHDGVIPFYQGIYDNKRQNIHHYEALMRLQDENGDIYLPKDFLGVARSFGLMYDSLSILMIKKVFEQFKDEEGKSVSINLGIRDIKNSDVLDYIYDALSTMKHPEHFIFEILENEDIDDYNLLISFVDKIHELGGLIAIDDFGSGYSNLQHILSIHSDYIKIDGSIIRNCCIDKESENLIALITGWKSLSERNVKIIAEFVENEEIQKKIMSYNIDYSQGYLFSKPSPTF